MTVRVLLADDQVLLRSSTAMVLGAEPDFRVVAEVGDGHQAVRSATALRPDVAVLDVQMPGLDGVEACRRIRAASPSTGVLVLTTYDVDDYALGALAAGASGFLLKDCTSADLTSAVRSVARGHAVLAPRVAAVLVERARPSLAAGSDAALDVLTERERDVHDLLVDGLSNAEIAARLVVAPSTVKTHVAAVLHKLGARDRLQLALRRR